MQTNGITSIVKNNIISKLRAQCKPLADPHGALGIQQIAMGQIMGLPRGRPPLDWGAVNIRMTSGVYVGFPGSKQAHVLAYTKQSATEQKRANWPNTLHTYHHPPPSLILSYSPYLFPPPSLHQFTTPNHTPPKGVGYSEVTKITNHSLAQLARRTKKYQEKGSGVRLETACRSRGEGGGGRRRSTRGTRWPQWPDPSTSLHPLTIIR